MDIGDNKAFDFLVIACLSFVEVVPEQFVERYCFLSLLILF